MNIPSVTREGVGGKGVALALPMPQDEHNRRLIENVHPPHWANPKPDGRYNIVVIGAGTAGLVTAAGAAGLGAKVALIERAFMGGDCLNVGCVPSKAIIRSARAAHDARNTDRFGVRVHGDVEVDFPVVMERMRRARARISPHDSARRFQDLGIDVYLGDARFTSTDRVEVGGQTLRFARACIATGTRPVEPPIPGLQEAGFITNESLFNLTELPARLAVLGGGPIGCEMAQAFARFGSTVYLLEMAQQVLGREDREAAEIVQEALTRDGVRLRLKTTVVEVHAAGEGRGGRLVLECEGARDEVVVDEVLVSVGRKPNVEGLGLEPAGVEYDATRGVKVDDRLRTSNRRIFAAGDICYPYKFTHTADALARIVIRNALFFGRTRSSVLHVPWCTYTDPEIAHVGMYEHEAKQQGMDVETIRIDFKDVDRAILEGEDEGFLKVHHKAGSDRIVGATLVARHAGDMISEITLTMQGGLGLGDLSNTIHPYPTQAEVMRKAGDAYNRSRLTPRVKKLFTRIMALRR